MTILTSEWLNNEMDYISEANNEYALYKDYYAKICSYIYKKNRFLMTPSEIEEYLDKGYMDRCKYYKCKIANKDDRIYYFKRAMGLQLIYDENNGRNSMISEKSQEYDFCRETHELLDMLGLIQPIRW